MAQDQESRRAPAALLRALGQVKAPGLPQVPGAMKVASARMQQLLLEASKNDDTPEGVPPMDRPAKALFESALALAAGPGSDEAAVTNLRRQARKHPAALRVAEIQSRAGGRFRDFSVENRAQRLLSAALSGQAVRLISATERRRIDAVEPFSAESVETQWRVLRAAVPGLEDLWAAAVEGRFVRPAMSEEMSTEERTAAWQETRRRYAELQSWVRTLVGPLAHPDDPLLGSRYVENFVMTHLPAGGD